MKPTGERKAHTVLCTVHEQVKIRTLTAARPSATNCIFWVLPCVIHRDALRNKCLQIHCLDRPSCATTSCNAGITSDATFFGKEPGTMCLKVTYLLLRSWKMHSDFGITLISLVGKQRYSKAKEQSLYRTVGNTNSKPMTTSHMVPPSVQHSLEKESSRKNKIGIFFIYLLRSHIFQVFAHHDAPEFGFNEPFCSFSFSWPEKEKERMFPSWQQMYSATHTVQRSGGKDLY